MLGGGDLDGDLYKCVAVFAGRQASRTDLHDSIIQDTSLFPKTVDAPASHASPLRKFLARNCTVGDVIDFMLEYCQVRRAA
jgi:hypothetical protein